MRSAVTIGVITYKRPGELARLLDALADESSGTHEILVVDNDGEQSAASVVEASALAVRYVCEPEAGTSHARNRLMDECTTPWLASLDDDEVPQPGWLDALLSASVEHDAEMVAGPVLTEFLDEPADWIRDSGLFERPNPPSGTVLQSIRGGNLLLNVSELKRLGIRYDPDFNKGGQDIQFSLAASAAGAKIVWTREAPIVEYVGAERLTRGWLSERLAKTYCNYWRAQLRTGRTSSAVVLTRFPLNVGLTLYALVRRDRDDARLHWAHSKGTLRAVSTHLQQRVDK